MCLVLYIGLNGESPLIAPQDFSAIDSEDPSWPLQVAPFSVEDFGYEALAVKKHFATKFVRYAGSFEGCGCGFNACHVNEWEEPVAPDAKALAGRVSRGRLLEYVKQYKVNQIYACWSCDEALPPTEHLEIPPERIIDWNFKFPERAMLHIIRSEVAASDGP